MKTFAFANLEITTYCNARCPFCNRLTMTFKNEHMDIELLKKIPFERIKKILLLGNNGDPIFYPKLFEFLDLIDSDVNIHTNASAHSTDWWRELAKYKNVVVIYGIDGLEDTHSMHRIGTDFNKIVTNIRAFNEAGGRSIGQFLKFKHNLHQIDDVRDLCKSIGSTGMWIRTSRDYNETLQRPDDVKTRFDIYKERRKVTHCDFVDGPSFYLRIDGELRPCCFMGCNDYKDKMMLYVKREKYSIEHLGAYKIDPKSINLNYNTFDDIMNSDFFKSVEKNYRKLWMCNIKCRATFSDVVDGEKLCLN